MRLLIDRVVGSHQMCFLHRGNGSHVPSLVPLLLAGALQYDKGIRLQRDVGNCPSSTTDVTHVPSSQRQLSSMIRSMAMRPCHLYGAPLCPEAQTSWLQVITALPQMGTGLSELPSWLLRSNWANILYELNKLLKAKPWKWHIAALYRDKFPAFPILKQWKTGMFLSQGRTGRVEGLSVPLCQA